MTSSGIEPATFWFVAQHFNHCGLLKGMKCFTIMALNAEFYNQTILLQGKETAVPTK